MQESQDDWLLPHSLTMYEDVNLHVDVCLETHPKIDC